MLLLQFFQNFKKIYTYSMIKCNIILHFLRMRQLLLQQFPQNLECSFINLQLNNSNLRKKKRESHAKIPTSMQIAEIYRKKHYSGMEMMRWLSLKKVVKLKIWCFKQGQGQKGQKSAMLKQLICSLHKMKPAWLKAAVAVVM